LLRFDHATQNKLAQAIIKYKIKPKDARLHREFIKRYNLNHEKYETIPDVANAIRIPYGTIKHWVAQATKISPKVRARRASSQLTDYIWREISQIGNKV